MRPPLRRFRHFYGSHPVHLLVVVAGFALLGYVLATVGLSALWNPDHWWQSIAVWFAAAIVAHDLVLFPVYALGDRLLTARRDRAGERTVDVAALNYLRIPLLASGLLLLLFLPGIIKQGGPAYQAATGQTQEPFFSRWLLLTAALFAASALFYAVRLSVRARRKKQSGQPTSPGSRAGPVTDSPS